MKFVEELMMFDEKIISGGAVGRYFASPTLKLRI